MNKTHHINSAPELAGIGELLGSSWQDARERYGQMLPLSLASTGVSIVAIAIGYALYLLTQQIVAVWVYGVFAALVVIVVGVYAQAASLAVALHPPRTLKNRELLAAGNALASPLFFTSLLYGLGVVLGLVLFVLPGIWFAYRYSLSMFVLASERTTVRGAFKQSAIYTKGHFWALVFRALAFLFIYFLVAGVVNGAAYALLRAFGMSDSVHVNLSSLVNVFLAPWYILYGVHVYHSLRLAVEHRHQ